MTRNFRTVPFSFALTLSLFVLTACGGGGGGGSIPTVPGTTVPALRILATDAPFPFDDVESAVVLVHRVEMRQVGLGFEVLKTYTPPKTLDLVELRNGTVDVLYEGSPAPGTYDAIRIIVTAKDITIDDQGTMKTFDDFKVPSGEQTGIKVFVDNLLTISSSLSQDLVLDFDLGRSFIVQGNPGTPAGIKGFHFKPVIRAINASTAGSLTFLVKSDAGTPGDTTDDFYLDGAAYDVVDDSVDPAKTVASGASGVDPANEQQHGFVFHPTVRAGIYKLTVSSRDHDNHTQSLVIAAANLVDLGIITLAGTSGVIEGVVTTKVTLADGSTFEYVVVGAEVSATAPGASDPSATDVTSTLGKFALSPLATGTWDVVATKPGYTDAVGQATPRVFGAAPVSLGLELIPLTANVSGTVTATNGSPVQGATVTATLQGKVVASTTTDSSGAYSLASLPTGDYEIATVSGNLAATVDHTHVGGGSAATVDMLVQ